MGKHDSDESMGFFLGGAEKVKDGSLWILRNLKRVFLIALIPAVGFGSYYLTKYIANHKAPKTEPTYVMAPNLTEDKDEKKKEYIGGYEVLGELKSSKAGINVKVLDPEIDGEKYVEDSLQYGAIYYYGEKLDDIGNSVILGHNTTNSFYGLKELEPDDSITFTDQNGNTTNYTVIEKLNCEPDDLSSLLPMEEDTRELTLVTCETEGTQRLVIKATAK